MKKSLIVTLALVFVLGIAGTAFAAANPFVDVPAKHWAYDAVSKLAQAGVVDGYGDGTFRGDKTITRYEMAQIVAKAMTRSDKQNAETKALVDKLAVEFSAELQNLGVRVAKLEKEQANLKFNGQVDIRYTATDANSNSIAGAAAGQYRLRMNGVAKVDEDTTLGMRFTTQPGLAGDATAGKYQYNGTSFISFGTPGNESNSTNSFAIDRLFVTRNLGTVTTTLGAQEMKIGSTGILMDNNAMSFDGVKFAGKAGVVNMSAQWGRFHQVDKVDVATFDANTTSGKLAYGVGFANLKDNTESVNKDLRKYVYGNVSYLFDKKFSLTAEYAKNSATGLYVDDNDKSLYIAKALYGDQVIAKKGDNNIALYYMDLGRNAVTRWNAYDISKATTIGGTDAITGIDSQKIWMAQYTYGFSKNLNGWLVYESVTDKDNDNQTAADQGYKYWRVGVTAKF